MTPQALVELVTSFYHLFESGNAEAAADLLSEDIEWHNPMPEQIPFGGEYRGRAAVIAYWTELMAALEMGPMEVDQMVAQDDTVVVVGRESSTARSTGKEYQIHWVHLYKITDGKIVYVREYNHTAAMLQAFV
ncbi:nuclear transport factor 2 family protein [Pseudomaricurvus alkylphenolicus]|uniref:nuclear transport factor 2 family protein n=1 Tax=Pseudomaricurvus alkylphenolicus TaxID=1306991 RepID=UPI0014212699|nr:nuclear transport factor 2 family protein [Pseudomaricurvus alkylphenolicus]NIB41504.1 nuclear transport factor 2 family protein [Pseudomaricurvus alkylphenolicus]